MGDTVFLTTEELAERWRMSSRTLENWRINKSVSVPYHKIGGSVLYKLSDIEEYEAKQLVQE